MIFFFIVIFPIDLQTPSKKKLEVVSIASNYHIEVNPSDVGIYDRVVIQEIIKNVASAQQLDSSGQREFKGRDEQQLLHIIQNKYIEYDSYYKINVFRFEDQYFFQLWCSLKWIN